MAKKKNYVDNEEFLRHMIAYRAEYEKNKSEGLEPPRISHYIGKTILDIANGVAARPNFSSYSYKEEMISDAIENCLRYLHSFDPNKGSKPFAYFTQITWYAFLRRIEQEKKQSYIKQELVSRIILDDSISEEDRNYFEKTFLSQEQDVSKMAELDEKFKKKPKKEEIEDE